MNLRLSGLALVLALVLPATLSAQTVLVSEGRAHAVIVIAPRAGDLEKSSAHELQSYIGKISGVELPIVLDGNGERATKVFVGESSPDAESFRTVYRESDPASFRLSVAGDTVQLIGLSDIGTAYAVYELLEQLGVRWFMPGDLGTVIPSTKTIAVAAQDAIQHPGFSTRILQAIGDVPWAQFMRLGGPDYGREGFPCGIRNDARPDLFLLDAQGRPTPYLDVSKPEVLDCVVQGSLSELETNPNLKYLSMGPLDGVPSVVQPNPEWDGTDVDPSAGVLSGKPVRIRCQRSATIRSAQRDRGERHK